MDKALCCSKAAIEQKLSSISSLAASSVKQAEVLPSVRFCFLLSQLFSTSGQRFSMLKNSLWRLLQRALLHWMLLATKLLRRLHSSEHLQVRYRTARMLEIWDMAASSMPSSPVRPLGARAGSIQCPVYFCSIQGYVTITWICYDCQCCNTSKMMNWIQRVLLH